MMPKLGANANRSSKALTAGIILLLLSTAASAGKKKAPAAPEKPVAPKSQVDTSKLVWPGPPNIPRVRYTSYFSGEKLGYSPASEQPKKKQGWMDRLAGVQDPNNKLHLKALPFQLLAP